MNKILEGAVVSLKMNQTAIVSVETRVTHPVYKKLMARNKRYKADTGRETFALGDRVRMEETRPLSKDKHFKIVARIGDEK